MRLLAWNCQGLGRALTAHQLKELCKLHSPQLIFLAETKNQFTRVDFIRRFVGMDGLQIVDPIGTAGGLVVLWKQDLKVRLVRKSSFFIELLITDDESGQEWHLVNLYASTHDGIRKGQWDELLRYRQQSSGDWVLWGDFNDLLWEDEKQGGRRREAWSLRAFRHFVNNLGAIDMGFSGYPFTWASRRYGDGLVKERLDRVLVSSDWRLNYDRAMVKHLFTVGSDHAALLLDTNPPKMQGFRQFRFDSRWCEDSESHEVIKRSWKGAIRGSKMFEVFQKVKNCRKELRHWSKQKGFNARKKINDLQQRLESIGSDQRSGEIGEVRALEKELSTAWDQEEKYWRQKARVNWMTQGDRNTAFFHAKVNQRRKRNVISGVQNSNGLWCDDPDEVANEFVQYFQEIFTSEGTEHMEEVTNTIHGRISETMNSRLTKDFSRGEIKKALFDMDPTKAPGADGMTAGFYQHYWDIIGDDVTNAVQSFFRTGQILRSFNHTQIVLIPKVKTPVQVSQYRPISLCNVLYKIIAKALANRLRDVLPQLISPNQSAFIQNRQICDNILVAHELVHHLKNRRNGKEGQMALKLDIAKAYDRVEWVYLEKVMQSMGFNEKWRNY